MKRPTSADSGVGAFAALGASLPGRVIQLSPLTRYAVAVVVAVTAVLIRLAFDPLWGTGLPFITFFPAIMLSAWLGGLWPGVVTTLLTAVAAEYFWIEPARSWAVANPTEWIGLAVFVAVGIVMSALNESWRTLAAAAQRRTTELHHLRAIAETAISHLDSDSLIRELLATVRAMLHCDTATMLLVDSKGEHLTAVASVGLEEAVDAKVRIPVGQGVAGRIAAGNSALVVDDLATADIVNPVLRKRLTSLVGVPLKVGDRLIGVLHAGSATPRRFSQADVGLLSLAGDRIAVAIERARLIDSERAALREAETSAEQLRVALEAGRMGTWEYSIRTGALRWSPGLEAIHGYAPGTFPGTFDAFRQEIHPEDRERVLQAISEAVARRRDHLIEYRIVRGDGTVRWVEGRGQLFLDTAQQPDRLVGVCSDITARKQAEERLRDIDQQRGELLVREQTARAELERASKSKDEFLAVLSHELRTPLNAVLGYAHLLGSTRLPPKRAAHAIAAIQRNAKAQTRLIESLLDLSRIMAGKLELELEPLDVAKLVEAAVDLIRPDAEAKEITLAVVVPAIPGLVGDGGRLQQVFGNLLSNAVKFTPRGGRIGIDVSQNASAVTIQITDTGQGITPEFLPYVFDRFKQAEGQKGRSPTGLGLGLALVREMVHAHGGSVTAESAGDGQGATFTVTLPLTAKDVHKHPAPPSETEATNNVLPRLDILIVDDDGDVRDLLGLLLESRGAVIRTASSAAEALASIAGRKPDVLLADVGMPEEDGYSLIRRVRAAEGNGNGRLSAIAVTAYARAGDRDEALAAGFDGHIAKPVDPDTLAQAIARVARTQRSMSA